MESSLLVLQNVVKKNYKQELYRKTMTIKLTEAAAAEAKSYIEDSKEKYLRVAVMGGGCSGFQYNLTVVDEYDKQRDTLSHQHGVDVIVDKKSNLYLDGTILDYYNDITRQGFSFDNPNAVKSCGCGSSFQA
tara:strand:- start:882 stop:1277 length:396 start_codon:yes stop_codon:yes gene_type:complete